MASNGTLAVVVSTGKALVSSENKFSATVGHATTGEVVSYVGEKTPALVFSGTPQLGD